MRPVVFVVRALLLAAVVIAGHLAEARPAGSLSGYFEALRYVRVLYSNVGSVCEQVARIDLTKQYDSQIYSIDTNVLYGYGNEAVGELDVVVLDRLSNTVVKIYEIKCWSGAGNNALRTARKQRERFFETMGFSASPRIWSRQVKYSAQQFRNITPAQYLLGGPPGRNFEYELPLTTSELNQLFAMIVACQKAGDCAQP